MSESNVLTVALVASANNYARALADWAYGSESKFLPVANAWLKQHGLTHTTLTDCTGLNAQTRSIPTDLIKLGELALANPVVARIMAIQHTTLPIVGEIQNTNKLLGKSGVLGIKTGTLLGAGASLLFASKYSIGGRVITLVGVILDGPTHPVIDSQIRRLITAARAGFVRVSLATSGERFGTYSTKWHTSSTAVATKSISVVVWAGSPISSTITLQPISLARRNTAVGTVHFTVAGTPYSVPLALNKSITDPGPKWRLTHPGGLS